MATLRSKRKLATVSRYAQKSDRKDQSQNTSVPGMTEEYITQMLEEIEGRFTKKTVPGIQSDGVTFVGCFVKTRRIFSEPASADLFRNRSVNIPE